jgi:hypothetical protein
VVGLLGKDIPTGPNTQVALAFIYSGKKESFVKTGEKLVEQG